MPTNFVEAGDPYAITNASTSLALDGGVLLRIVTSTSTSGTLTITESRSSGRTITSVMPLTAGQSIPLNVKFLGALTLTGGGTFAATLVVA